MLLPVWVDTAEQEIEHAEQFHELVDLPDISSRCIALFGSLNKSKQVTLGKFDLLELIL